MAKGGKGKYGKGKDGEGKDGKGGDKTQVWLINPFGGEAWVLTKSPRDVQAFGWSAADDDQHVFSRVGEIPCLRIVRGSGKIPTRFRGRLTLVEEELDEARNFAGSGPADGDPGRFLVVEAPDAQLGHGLQQGRLRARAGAIDLICH